MIHYSRIIVATTLFISAFFTLSAQDFLYEEVRAKEYEKAEKRLIKDYAKIPDDVIVNYNLSVLYTLTAFKGFNPDTAYYFSKQADFYYNELSPKQREKLIRTSLTLNSIREQTVVACSAILKTVKAKNSIEAYNFYIDTYRDSPELTSEAIELRNQLAYELVIAKPTIDGFNTFLRVYPKSTQYADVVLRRDALVYKDVALKNRAASYREFITTYPNSHLKEVATVAYDEALFKENVDCNSVKSIMDFAYKHSSSTYSSVIFDTLFYVSNKQLAFEGFDYYVRFNSNGKYADKAWKFLYEQLTIDGKVNSLQVYDHMYQSIYPNTLEYAVDFNAALLGENLHLDEGYDATKDSLYWNYMKAAYKKDYAFKALQVVLQPSITAKKWDAALAIVDKALPIFAENDAKVLALRDIIASPLEGIKSESLGAKLASPQGSEYVPVVTADGKTLYFCGLYRSDNFGGEDIFVSENKKGVWQTPILLKSLATTGNDAPESVSTDGNTLTLFINGDIYYSTRTKAGWGAPVKFPAPINSEFWEGDGVLSSDGKTLMFVSERENKSGSIYTNKDIFVCRKGPNGWGEAINIGKTINSRYDERSPYLHYDMKTLYFSSLGHGGLGNYDVFMSTRLNDSTWTEWSEPVNLGKEINSIKMDWNYKINTQGDKAYFSIDNNNRKHKLFSATLPAKVRPSLVAMIYGGIKGLDGLPIDCTIYWEDLTSGKTIGESKTNPVDGSYYVVLPLGKQYGYYIEKDGYFPLSRNFDLTKEKASIAKEDTIILPAIDLMVTKGLPVPLNNLFFDVDKDIILSSSYPELDRVVEIIQARNLRVELSGHTDNSGSKEHNADLSERRAKAVASYLISKGIFPRAITAAGFGDTKPVAPNTTDIGRSKNRRVEVKFVK